MNDRDRFVDYLLRYVGTPYLIGGDDPMTGFDCSGLVVEGLQAVGKIRHGSDYTADGLYQLFRAKVVGLAFSASTPGCLNLYLDGAGKATHVEASIGEGRILGAIGGGFKTLTLGDAVKSNAFVKIRPVGYRGGPSVAIDPFQ